MNDEIKKNGVVFTPEKIVKYMTSFIDNKDIKKILEPSCGMGYFVEHIDKKHNITCIDINKTYISHCSGKFKSIKCITKNFIDFKTNDKYDYIIGNPPYVKIQNIDDSDLIKMKTEFPNFINGNTNLYIYFIIKCFNLLNDNGKLIFIVPNNWLYSKSFTFLKDFIFENKYLELLIDFKHKQVFKDVSTYTCIMILSKKENEYYNYSNNINKVSKIYYNKINKTNKFKLLDIMTPRIGLMTLKDEVYIIKNYVIKNNYVYFSKNNKEYIIERDACKNILKVSKNKLYLIIYPYEDGVIIADLKNIYPLTYNYLLKYKKELSARDNGNKKYIRWYAYGRTQSLKIKKEKRLFLSTLVKNIKGSLIEKSVDLYYSGLYIEPKNKNSIKYIKDNLVKNEKNILNNSNNKSNNWYSLSVNSFK